MPDAGHVRVYEWSGSTWLQMGVDISGKQVNDVESGCAALPVSSLATSF